MRDEDRLKVGTHITRPEISGIAPFFIVRNVPAALSFYRDRLGFDITYQGPDENDVFFGIVQRGAAMIMLKDIGVTPVPNYTRDIKKGIARWDAYLHVPDPDSLAAEFQSRHVEFFQPLMDNEDGLRGFEIKDADGYMLFFGRPTAPQYFINAPMIARMWHGRTAAENSETYTDFLKQVAIPDYRRTAGFRGLTFLRRLSEQEAHFNLITYWDNLDVIRDFAGQDIEKAKYYPEDHHFLLEFEEHVQHFEVFAEERPNG